MQGFDDLENFRNWWMNHRPINTPAEKSLVSTPDTHGVVLYRQAPYQVELFTVRPNCEIPEHIHPNVDSYEVYVSGDIAFTLDGNVYTQHDCGASLRVPPSGVHGGKFGERGGCFISIQKWLNNVQPTFVGDDWVDGVSRKSYYETFNTAKAAGN